MCNNNNNNDDSSHTNTSRTTFFLNNAGKSCQSIEPNVLPRDFHPTPYCVMIGRGNECSNAIGNRRMKIIVDIFLDRYSKATTKSAKSGIVTDVVDMIRSGGGHFIKRRLARFKKESVEDNDDSDEDYNLDESGAGIHKKPINDADDHADDIGSNNISSSSIVCNYTGCLWEEVGDAMAREKVGATFRDRLHTKYRSSSKAKCEARRRRSSHTGGTARSKSNNSIRDQKEQQKKRSHSAILLNKSQSLKSFPPSSPPRIEEDMDDVMMEEAFSSAIPSQTEPLGLREAIYSEHAGSSIRNQEQKSFKLVEEPTKVRSSSSAAATAAAEDFTEISSSNWDPIDLNSIPSANVYNSSNNDNNQLLGDVDPASLSFLKGLFD